MDNASSEKRAKFIELAELRVNRAIKDIRLIGNLSNRNSYQYDQDDVVRILGALHRELDATKKRFEAGGKARDDSFRVK